MHLDVPTSICNLKGVTFATRGLKLEADELYAQQLVDARVVFLASPPVGDLGLSVSLTLFASTNMRYSRSLSIWTTYDGASRLRLLACSLLIWDAGSESRLGASWTSDLSLGRTSIQCIA